MDNSGQVRAVGEAATPYRPSDAQIAYHLGRFIGLVRSLSIDPIVVRQNWLDAYDYTTDKGAVVLNEYARVNDPFARIGGVGDGAGQQRDSRERYVVQRALDGDPFRQRCAGPHRTLERCRVHRAADAAHRAACAQEPLGIYVNGLSWSRELEANEGAKP